jgi:hypothetical protein
MIENQVGLIVVEKLGEANAFAVLDESVVGDDRAGGQASTHGSHGLNPLAQIDLRSAEPLARLPVRVVGSRHQQARVRHVGSIPITSI